MDCGPAACIMIYGGHYAVDLLPHPLSNRFAGGAGPIKLSLIVENYDVVGKLCRQIDIVEHRDYADSRY